MLSSRTEDKVLQALSGLRNDPRFIVVLDYLKKELEQSTIRLWNIESAPTIHKLQGACLTLEAFLQKARDAKDVLTTREFKTPS